MSHRPTMAELADRARQEWLMERHEAETAPCPDCSAPAGVTCRGLHGPLQRAPAHPGRIRAWMTAPPRPALEATRSTGVTSRSTGPAPSAPSSPTPSLAA